jgi:Ras-related protein Rab-12
MMVLIFEIPQYASEDAELLLVGNKLDCETDREITRQQGEKVRA